MLIDKYELMKKADKQLNKGVYKMAIMQLIENARNKQCKIELADWGFDVGTCTNCGSWFYNANAAISEGLSLAEMNYCPMCGASIIKGEFDGNRMDQTT